MGEIELVQLDNSQRIEVLEKLGYSVDRQGFVVDKEKKRVICKYNQEEVHINTAAILPGSTIIINTNPVSMAQYFVDFESQDG